MRRTPVVVFIAVAVFAAGCSSGGAEWEEAVHELADADFFGAGLQASTDCAEMGYDADAPRERVQADTEAANEGLANSGPEVLTPSFIEQARATGEVPDDVTDEEILAVWSEYIWNACKEIASQ